MYNKKISDIGLAVSIYPRYTKRESIYRIQENIGGLGTYNGNIVQ